MSAQLRKEPSEQGECGCLTAASPAQGLASGATRYEKGEVNYLAMVTIAAIVLLWLE